MIKILDSSFTKLGVIKNAISSNRLEEINGENILDFEAVLDQKLNNLIDENSIYELDNDWFDTASFKKNANEDNTFTIGVETDHISYRLNREAYNVDYFTETGTPTYILGKILEGTDFSVGTIEYTAVTTYSAQEAKSRRQLLMEFASSLVGEVSFNKFAVSIVSHRGSITAKPVLKDRNVKIVNKSVNKRQLDENGNPTVSYSCTPLYLPGDIYALGDNVILKQKELGISEDLRVVSISRDVYDSTNVTFQFANYIDGLASSLYNIATMAVSKDSFYNGTRIGPEFGFEAIRNDKMARAYFRSDGMAFQSGDGSGTTWKDRLYYEYDPVTDDTVLVFDGKLTADMITALGAIITPNLYAGRATIAELTVDSLDTDPKVQNYLRADEADINYCRIVGQIIQFVTGKIISNYGAERTDSGFWDMVAGYQLDIYYSTVTIKDDGSYILTGATATIDAFSAYQAGRIYRTIDTTSYYKITGIENTGIVYYDVYTIAVISNNYEQLKSRKGEPMYWVDEAHEAATEEITTFPVFTYIYNETVKMEFSFELDGTTYEPMIRLGAGDGVTENSGKAYIYKDTDGLYFRYYKQNTGTLVSVGLTDGGAVGFGDGIPVGGVLGQVLTKQSSTAGDAVWADVAAGNMVTEFFVQPNDPVSAGDGSVWIDTTAIVIKDIFVSAQSMACSAALTLLAINGNIPGISIAETGNLLYFSTSIYLGEQYEPHSSITPYILWLNGAGSGTAVFKLEYEWMNIGDIISTTVIKTVTKNVTTGILSRTEFLSIDGINKIENSVLLIRVYRDTASASDTLTSNLFFLGVGIDIKIDKPGMVV